MSGDTGRVTAYSVVATRDHVEAMARAVSGPRYWGPLAWVGVPAGLWFGFVLAAALMPDRIRDDLLGWVVALGSAGLGGWLMARYMHWAVRARMRRHLRRHGWHEGSEHRAEFTDTHLTLQGPSSRVHEPYSALRSVEVRRDGVLLRRRRSRRPVVSVVELFPPAELERVRAGLPRGRGL